MKEYKFYKLIALFLIISGCSNRLHYSFHSNSSDILYLGVPNRLQIVTKSKKQIEVELDNGTISKVDSNMYRVEIDSLDYTQLTIRQGNKKYNKRFRNKKVPYPYSFKIHTSDSCYYENVVEASGFKTCYWISVVTQGFDYFCAFQVKSFELIRISNDGLRESLICNHAYETTELSKKAKSGDIFIFSDIVVQIGSHKEMRKINDIVVYIK